jgi:uncharacterized protein YyaL (SSP411 family)
MAHQMCRTFAIEVQGSPLAHTFFLCGLDFAIGPSHEVSLVGDLNEEGMKAMLRRLRGNFLPNMVVSLRVPRKSERDYEMIDGKPTAYICNEQACLPPTNSIKRVLELLEQPRK